jgi:hypothetical protein
MASPKAQDRGIVAVQMGIVKGSPMSALGQKRTLRRSIAMSAIPPKTDVAEPDRNVRFVPKADINHFLELRGMSGWSALGCPLCAASEYLELFEPHPLRIW